MGGGLVLIGWVKRIKKYRLLVIKAVMGGKTYSTVSTVSNIIITMCGARWVLG